MAYVAYFRDAWVYRGTRFERLAFVGASVVTYYNSRHHGHYPSSGGVGSYFTIIGVVD